MIITFTNKKGGVSKTTSALAFAAGLAKEGHKVLLLDLDPQGNASAASGTEEGEAGTFELLAGLATLPELIQHSEGGYDFISADTDLNKKKEELPKAGRELLLKRALKGHQADYDYILIDTPPSMDFFTIAAMVVTDEIIIPCRADAFTLDGIAELWQNIQTVTELYEHPIHIAGFLLNYTDPRTILNRQLLPLFRQTAEGMSTKVFDTIIREDIKLKEAQAAQQSIFDYAPQSHAAEDYRQAIKEFQEDVNK